MASNGPYFADVAALIGDPTRANILAALMDGRARTAKELAFEAGVSPQTTSGHLAKLADGRLLTLAVQGRHRYYHLADPLVACAIEAMMALSVTGPRRARPKTPAEEGLRAARTCYDHLAGRLGVGVMDHLAGAGHLETGNDDLRVTASGRGFFAGIGIDVDVVVRQRRGFARPCLDWSERRPHLAGGLGAALATRCIELGWIERQRDTRAVLVTAAGDAAFSKYFAIQC
jgi:DNA-binding transcriptional ArsR family regulator